MSHTKLQAAVICKRALDHCAAHLAEAHRAAGADKGLVQDIESMRRKLTDARARAQHVVKSLTPPEGALPL